MGQLTEISALWQMAQDQIGKALSNIDGAMQYIENGAQTHPNRLDIVQQSAPGTTTGEFLVDRRKAIIASANPFLQPANQPVNNVFGAPAASTNNVFGAPAAGTSTFGQPAGLGPTPSAFGAPAFGQPAVMGAAPSAFAQSSQTTGAFGQTSALGPKPSAFGAPAFGQPAQPTGAFGQPATLGAAPSAFTNTATNAFANPQPAPTAFGQPQQAATSNVFGAPPQGATTNVFGVPTVAPAAATSNVFGAPAPAAATSNVFGAPPQAATTNVFGAPPAAPAAATSNVFGAPAPAAPGHPFGQPPQAATSNVFGAPTPAPGHPFGQPPQQAPPTSFGAIQPAGPPRPQPSSVPIITGLQPDPSTYTVFGPDKRLQRFNNQPVTYMLLKKPEDVESALLPTLAKQKDSLDGLIKGRARQDLIDRLRIKNQEELDQLKYSMEVPVIRGFDGTIRRVWFPNGPPAGNADTEAPPGPDGKSPYDDPKVMQQWSGFAATGRFENGVMPEVPPQRSLCNWVF